MWTASQKCYLDVIIFFQANQDLVITDEQKQEFYDAIEYDEDKAEAAAAVAFAKDVRFFILLDICFLSIYLVKRTITNSYLF